MPRGVARTVIACVAFMALLLGLLVHKILSPPVMSHAQLSENGLFVYDIPRAVTPFALTDHEGQPFTQERLDGKWSLLFFGYTFCPDICPITLATIRQFEQLLQEVDLDAAAQLQVAMISVDPQRDTLDKLDAYMGYFNEDYIGATGEYIDVFNLGRQLNVAFGYTPVENGEYLVNHSGEIILINPRGEFHGFFKVPHDPQKMLRNFRAVFGSW
ncbi:MAG: SCO family protein [Pseudomonadota bacterium]|nr:SCO family protein [Pseudomonadota bacterium]